MAEGRRPGGLTALAVLNFVFAGLGLLVYVTVTVAMLAVDTATKGGIDTSGSGVSKGVVYVLLILGLARLAIMLTAGVGYLKMKRFLGRTLGNVYAILAIADTVISIALAHSGVGLGTIIGLVYPVLTLILINTTFKDDLVN
jgi:hypothetical protein